GARRTARRRVADRLSDGRRHGGTPHAGRGAGRVDGAAPALRERSMSVFDRIKAGLARTTRQFRERFDEISRDADSPAARTREIDVDTVDALEELLICADVGVAAADAIVDAVRKDRSAEPLRERVKREIRRILDEANRPPVEGAPQVVLIVGVNGTGKTTTVGKLAAHLKATGRTP